MFTKSQIFTAAALVASASVLAVPISSTDLNPAGAQSAVSAPGNASKPSSTPLTQSRLEDTKHDQEVLATEKHREEPHHRHRHHHHHHQHHHHRVAPGGRVHLHSAAEGLRTEKVENKDSTTAVLGDSHGTSSIGHSETSTVLPKTMSTVKSQEGERVTTPSRGTTGALTSRELDALAELFERELESSSEKQLENEPHPHLSSHHRHHHHHHHRRPIPGSHARINFRQGQRIVAPHGADQELNAESVGSAQSQETSNLKSREFDDGLFEFIARELEASADEHAENEPHHKLSAHHHHHHHHHHRRPVPGSHVRTKFRQGERVVTPHGTGQELYRESAESSQSQEPGSSLKSREFDDDFAEFVARELELSTEKQYKEIEPHHRHRHHHHHHHNNNSPSLATHERIHKGYKSELQDQQLVASHRGEARLATGEQPLPGAERKSELGSLDALPPSLASQHGSQSIKRDLEDLAELIARELDFDDLD